MCQVGYHSVSPSRRVITRSKVNAFAAMALEAKTAEAAEDHEASDCKASMNELSAIAAWKVS